METSGIDLERITQNFTAACAEITEWKKTAEMLHKRVLWLCKEASKVSCPPQKLDCQHKNARDEMFCGLCWLEAVTDKIPGEL